MRLVNKSTPNYEIQVQNEEYNSHNTNMPTITEEDIDFVRSSKTRTQYQSIGRDIDDKNMEAMNQNKPLDSG